MIQGEELVGGSAALQQRMADWGYSEQTGSIKDAVELYQKIYKVEIDGHSQQIHGRPVEPDGDIGPATARVIHGRFCNVPDSFGGPEEARWPDS